MPPAILSLEPIAVFTHNFRSRSPLSSWPPVPAEQIHQGEMLAFKAFGSLLEGIRSPAHIYMASWRDPDPRGYPETEQDEPPTSIFFVGNFGVAPYKTTPSLIETADMFNRLDRALLRMKLVRDEGGSFRLDDLEVEMTDPSPVIRQDKCSNSDTGRLDCAHGFRIRDAQLIRTQNARLRELRRRNCVG